MGWCLQLNARHSPRVCGVSEHIHTCSPSNSLAPLSPAVGRLSEECEYFAYGLSTSGSDWVTVRFIKGDDLSPLPDVLERVKFSCLAWTHDAKGVFYNCYPPQGGKADGMPSQRLLYICVCEKVKGGQECRGGGGVLADRMWMCLCICNWEKYIWKMQKYNNRHWLYSWPLSIDTSSLQAQRQHQTSTRSCTTMW